MVDNAFIMISAALVLLMTPGLAMFYGGMARQKNVLGTMMHSFIMLGIVSVIWALWGFSIAFGPDVGGLFGSLKHFALVGVGFDKGLLVPDAAKQVGTTGLTFMVFQCMFAIITVALITGAFAERIKFSAFFLFSILWVTFVYSPLCHWVWGPGGWIGKMGALDFAGGTVVHISSGTAALACVLVLGNRKGFKTEAFIPHNLPLTILGAGLLWFGWFGFNAGSALSANSVAASAFVVTNIAAAMASVTWICVEWIHRGKPTTLGAASGAVAGLVAITPASGFVATIPALIIGIGAGFFCYLGCAWKMKLGYDDALDVVGIHGVGGTWGALATGIFAGWTGVVQKGSLGLLAGKPSQLWIQLLSILATIVFVFIATIIILYIVKALVGLRVSEEDEVQGLDLSQHGESGYAL
jgi:Amt family ammonium transporter